MDDALLADQPGSGPGPEVMALDPAEFAEVRVRSEASDRRIVRCWASPSAAGSPPEVAHVLEIPVGTVKSHMAAARSALNRTLEEKGQDRERKPY